MRVVGASAGPSLVRGLFFQAPTSIAGGVMWKSSPIFWWTEGNGRGGTMKRLWEIAGNVLAVSGAVVCVAAVIARIAGHYHVMGSEISTIFLGGIAVMVMGALSKIHALSGTNRG